MRAQLELTAEQEELLSLLRTKGMSIKSLDEEKRRELSHFLDYLCNTRGYSLNDVARLIGNKTSGYSSWLCRQLGVRVRPFEEARLKGIREKRRKYERRPFDGTEEDRAYLLGLRHGDLSVSRPWNGAIRVSTSTTHPAMIQLFRSLFEPYGHIYQHPRFKRDTRTYEWNIQTILDDSFSFLLRNFLDVKEWVEASESRTISYLSGFLDAEGSILVTHNTRGRIVIFVDYFNENKSLLEWIGATADHMGLGFSLRLNKPIGRGTTGFHLNHNAEYWQLSIFSAHAILRFIQRLVLRHPEKLERRKLALGTAEKVRYDEVYGEVVTLRTRIKNDVSEFVKLAERRYLETHPSRLELTNDSRR